ncbi:hypothetical protein R4P47_12115 [Rhodococcus sp. IEGM 1370]|uniref:hypothetical protein n=1 Tax=Rhodococcus sp. IEGM 1370 TaxID=3082222 RepID=UPI00295299C1|nr:hypothetical protein [Rhodococcus sp. IEGM 1370]MDV8077304.1 hypothetical protein [Rhodococcus sp. IEGM 1370]
MEPMRPVDYAEQSTSKFEERKRCSWHVFFACLVIGQFTAVLVYDIGFWPVALASAALCGMYELLWAGLNRVNSLSG